MTITQLKYTLAVAEHGNFTTASDKCFVTQPTLSMQVQKLEEELGVIIFNRSTKPLQVTDIGLKVLFQAKKIIDESSRMNDVISEEKGIVGGTLKVGIIPTVSSTLLPLFLNIFTKKHKNVELKIEEFNTETIIQKLEDNSIDCAIAATPLNNDKIIERPLYYEPFVAYVPEHHFLSGNKMLEINDLSNGGVLILKDGHCFRNQVLNLCTLEDLNKQYELKSGSFETLINLSNNGPWMTIIPYLHSKNLIKKNLENIIPFEEPSPAREISMVYSNSQLKLPVINALTTTISSVIRGQIKYNDVKIMSPVS
ncbi:MAG: LysR family transcriptional regulator [Cryomorphaceae bacterium]|mgnify:FL=1|jgi:LysR family hydrogen peroxide-inducible transcriptional activator|nr:LysR family transcriptional regulator [Cryomorphaceae bacterium]MDG1889381.1 LysR substrate-binding domain-containing protein [Flavobacteriaceae bacterium]MBT3502918.1 LysR family transcriptional regulator [Cryomorphaceae bacterium]MBT3688693.1 LysR family transcriptional regulator [Cryomorphaceae bacterium]MBT4222566.1 LysR family transcriptional regulator [Cryomorphaceae bacterium]